MNIFKGLFKIISRISKIVGMLVIFYVLGHFLLGFVRDAYDEIQKNMTYDGLKKVYESVNFMEVNDLFKEIDDQVYEFHPYYHFKTKKIDGKYVTYNSEGIRTTMDNPESYDKKVYMFGGSTMWGDWNPDKYTIPSYLQKSLGDSYRVSNYGEKAFISTQELNYLMELLSNGHKPDIVIFYDGCNDGDFGVYFGRPRYPLVQKQEMLFNDTFAFRGIFFNSNWWLLKNIIFEKIGLEKKLKLRWDDYVMSGFEGNAKKTVEYYEHNIRQIKALAREYGFKAYFFWQPVLLSLTRNVQPYEKDIIDGCTDGEIEARKIMFKVAKNAFSNRENEDIYFLGNIFDDINEPIYIDWCHTGPWGNQIIAEKMYDVIVNR